jgi:hypothetical protein
MKSNRVRVVAWLLAVLPALANAAPSPPAAPTNLVATPNATSITLGWTRAAGAVAEYQVFRASRSGGYGRTPLRAGLHGTRVTVGGIGPGKTAYYTVVARNAGGASPRSNEAAAAAGAAACDAYTGPAPGSLRHFEGMTHEHSAYSDGDPHYIPDDYYRIGREHGYDFVAGSEHSDSLDALDYATLHASCDPSSGKFDPTALEYCFLNSTLDQAHAQSSPTFLAIRGFEWTSDVFGHINVYFSRNFTNAKTDGGYALTMQTFWDWFTRSPDLPGDAGAASSPVPFGGGADGLAHFNHPHDKCLTQDLPLHQLDGDCDWNDYMLIPAAAERMFGIEAYNDSNRADRYLPYLAHALDQGWRLSFLGSEDEHFAHYAVEERPKTVTVASELSEAGFHEAWLARRTYALSPGRHLRVAFDAQGRPMGSQLRCDGGKSVPMKVVVTDRDGAPFAGSLVLFTDGGVELDRLDSASGTFQVPVLPGRHWYFVRVHDADGLSAAYVAPVWIEGR